MSGVLSPQAYGYAQTGQNALNMLNSLQNYQANRFALQQAQLAPAYSGLMGLVGKPDVTQDDILHNLAKSQRLGADVSGIASDLTEAMAQGMTPSEFVRQFAIRNIPAFEQAQMVGGQPQAFQTAGGTYTGVQTGPFAPGGSRYTPSGFIARGVSPEQWATPVPYAYNPQTGAILTRPWGEIYGGMVGGGAGAPAPSGAAAAAPASALDGGSQGAQGLVGPPGARGVPGSVRGAAGGLPWQHNPFLNALASAESGNRNIPSEVDPGGPQEVSQGYFQINTPTAQQFASAAGVDLRGRSVMQLSPEEQMQLVQAIPFLRFGPRTQRMLEREFGNIDSSMTIGQLASRFGGGPDTATMVAQHVVPGQATDISQADTGVPAGTVPFQYLPPVPGGGVGGGPAQGAPLPPGFVPMFGGGGYQQTGMPPGTQEAAKATVAGATGRQQAMEAQMNKSIDTRATLQGMEADLNNMPTSGVTAGPVATLKNAIISSGLATPQTVNNLAQGLSAQEQFDKFSSMLNQQLLMGMGGQATDARQELTGAATPSSIHSKLGNLGIIHMLEGNISALQAMGRAFRQDMNKGLTSPGQFDQWRDNFTAPTRDGARFDPRVFWLANMGAQEQQNYVNSLTPKDKAQLLKNANYAEQQGWVYENPDHTMGTGY